jgi:hypothetical protein
MKKTLIIDIEVHFPSASKIFEDSDYFAPCLKPHQMKCLQPIPSAQETLERYGFLPKSSWDQLDDSYERVVFIWPVHSFNDPGYTPNIEERQSYFKDIYDRIKNFNISKYIYIDDSDRAIVKRGLDWLDLQGMRCDVVFKREFRKNWIHDYDSRVHPFPFVMFGKPNAAWILYDESKRIEKPKINECFWAGVPRFNCDSLTPDEHVDRGQILNSVGHSIAYHSNLPFEVFIENFSNYKFFLNLNGNGHLCKRFFEGLSRGSLMMMQETDLVFPFEDGDYFSQQTIFRDGYEFLWKFQDLKNNEKLYKSCLINQDQIVKKYYNYEWIRNYIESKI